MLLLSPEFSYVIADRRAYCNDNRFFMTFNKGREIHDIKMKDEKRMYLWALGFKIHSFVIEYIRV